MSLGVPYYPPNIFFNDIDFNNDFYSIPNNNQGITLAYANRNYLFSTGVANSTAISTFFSGGVGIGVPSGVSGSLNALKFQLEGVNLFQNIPTGNVPTYTNATSTQLNSSTYYLTYITNGTLSIPSSITCDVLIVGAGGRGGTGNYSGGGGAGEVIYYPNFNIPAGSYQVEVGIDSSTPSNRISRIQTEMGGTGTDIIKANGGGDGGYWTIQTEIRR